MAKKKQLLIAMGCVIHQDAVLLIRRHEPDHPELHGNWELPGGKIDYGETPEEATEREILEETGIEVKALGMIPFPYSIIRREKGINPNIFCFQCQYIKGEIQSELPEKVSKVEWVSIPELNPHQIQSGSFLFINFLLKDLKTDVPNLFTEYKIEYIHLENVNQTGSKAADKTCSISLPYTFSKLDQIELKGGPFPHIYQEFNKSLTQGK